MRRVSAYRQRRVETKLYIGHVFCENKQVFVAIASSTQGTAVYVNGDLVRTSPQFELSSTELSGQPIVGTDALADNGWQGKLKGLAIYNRELTAAEVLQHYDAWTTNQNAEIKNEDPVVLYLFNEGIGNVVHNQMNSGTDLRIPEHYFVLHAPFLSPLGTSSTPAGAIARMS
ncbi:MAG: LamG-like jellyroll fold domain-containing protein [Terriglobales bacterium]